MTYSAANHSTISNQLEATSVSPLEQSGSNKNEILKSLIFKRAWALAAQKALRFGGEKCTYFAACLKVVYSQIKLTHTESRQQYGELMKCNNEYLNQLKERLLHYESNPDLLHREQTIADLLPRIKNAQVRQSYYIDLIFCTGVKL
ncbi:hypothetical protein [Photobacterium damselae]|uniref:hypothetical protein n=1 Tax=Photobacterium damselae TaxID=38293 RepID=UPI001EFC6718|nr:hypothetical protein [Photobacterium damselae]MCG9706461.1 hypothetical protein [Photobacterium damselae]